jgi:hypothetical protein
MATLLEVVLALACAAAPAVVPSLLPRALTMIAANLHQEDVVLIAKRPPCRRPHRHLRRRPSGQGALYADITVDGQCGAMTRVSLQSFIQRRGADGRAVLLKAMKSVQAGHYLGLAEASPSRETFVYDWLRSRILGLA